MAKKAKKAKAAKKKAAKKSASKRILLKNAAGKFFAKRTEGGTFKELDEVGRSLAADRRTKAKTKAKPGHGDQGDR